MNQEQREKRAGRRLLPDRLRVHSGVIRRVGRRWRAEVVVGDGTWRVTVRAEASGSGVALRRAYDAAELRLLQEPPPGK